VRSYGFQWNDLNPNLSIKKGKHVIFVIYIEDLIIMQSSENGIGEVKEKCVKGIRDDKSWTSLFPWIGGVAREENIHQGNKICTNWQISLKCQIAS
jgi:hypothetical protein